MLNLADLHFYFIVYYLSDIIYNFVLLCALNYMYSTSVLSYYFICIFEMFVNVIFVFGLTSRAYYIWMNFCFFEKCSLIFVFLCS